MYNCLLSKEKIVWLKIYVYLSEILAIVVFCGQPSCFHDVHVGPKTMCHFCKHVFSMLIFVFLWLLCLTTCLNVSKNYSEVCIEETTFWIWICTQTPIYSKDMVRSDNSVIWKNITRHDRQGVSCFDKNAKTNHAHLICQHFRIILSMGANFWHFFIKWQWKNVTLLSFLIFSVQLLFKASIDC